MKKVLIISYFAPPCTLTAAQRIASWRDNLAHNGYVPVIFTRNWDREIISTIDITKPSGKDIQNKVLSTSEIYYIPYKGNIRDRLLDKHRFNATLQLISKVTTFIEVLSQNFINQFIPILSIYISARKYIKTNPNISAIIISGNPFIQFKFGYLLHREFKIPWVADYRDDWTTSDINKPKSILQKLIRFFDAQSEKKWVNTAAAITSVSPYYVDKISKLTGRKGYILQNGFDESLLTRTFTKKNENVFRILYNGTLYPTQDIGMFLSAAKMVIDKYHGKLHVELAFPGLGLISSQTEVVKKIMSGYEKNLLVTGRVSKEAILELQASSNLLLMVAHKGIKGIPSSKIYEYLTFRKKILLCPGDKDILDQIITETKTGKVVDTIEEAVEFISQEIEHYLKYGSTDLNIPRKNILPYSRKEQAKYLAKLLDEITF